MANTRLPGQIIRSGSVPTTALGGGVISSSAQVISSLPAGTVSSSGQVSYTGLSNIPSGIISSSAQVTGLLPAGTVSSSAQVSYTGLSNIPSGILSSSAQINNLSGVSASFASTAPYTGLTGLPSLVSSSAQVQLSSITGTTFAASDFTFPQNLSVSGKVTANEFYTQVVSSSIIYQSGSTKFGDTVDDVMSVTGSIGISGSMIISSSGNVGIGTTTPTSRLSVNSGSIEFNRGTGDLGNNYLVLNKGANNDGGILLSRDNAYDWQIVNNTTSGDLGFLSYGTSTQVLYILRSSGNVAVVNNLGVGTTTPGSKLNIAGGNIAFDGTYGIHFNTTSGNAATSNAFIVHNQGELRLQTLNSTTPIVSMINSVEKMRVHTDGNVGIGTASPGATLHVQGNVSASSFTGSFSGSATNLIGGTSNYIPLWTSATAQSSSTIYQSSGKVSIGTTTANGMTTIYDRVGVNGTEILSLIGAASTGLNFIKFRNANNNSMGYVGFADNGNVGNSLYLWNDTNNSILLGTNNSERVRITGDGNLLVGLTAGTDSRLNIQVGNNQAPLYAIKARITDVIFPGSSSTAAVYAENRAFGTRYGVYATTTANYGPTYAGYFIAGGDASYDSYGIYAETTQNDTNGPGIAYGLYAVAKSVIGVTTSGYGIGITSAVGNYEKNINYFATSSYTGSATQIVLQITRNAVNVGNITTSTTATSYNTSPSSGIIGIDATTLAINTNSGERVRITSTGNVGVGTTSPSTLLHVQGVISASAITSSGDLSVAGLRVGRGGGAQSSNVAFGLNALSSNTAGNINVAVGYNALFANTSGSYNVAVGYAALQSNTTATNNTAIGYAAGLSITSGSENIAIGNQALYSNQTGQRIIAIGNLALYNSTVQENVAVGYVAGRYMTTGTYNTLIGNYAGGNNVAGSSNVAVGQSALQTANNSYNTAVGSYSLFSLVSTNGFTTAVGANAGYYITSGSHNTILGVFDGNQDGIDIRTANYNITIADGNSKVRLYYDGSSNYWAFRTGPSNLTSTEKMRIADSGNVGIGTTSPSNLLHLKASTNPVIRLEGASDSGYVDYNGTRLQLSAGGGDMYLVAGNSEKVRITNTGNVGISTATPYSLLQLKSNSETTGLSFFTPGYDSTKQWGTRIWKNDIGGGIPLQLDTQYLSTWHSSSRFDHGQDTSHPSLTTYGHTQLALNTGYVGIGTSSPAVPLHVDATSGGIVRVARSNAGAGTFQMEADGTDGTLAATNTMRLRAGGTERITVLSTGNVGIGTTNPSTLLDVSGSSTFRGAMQQGSIYRYGTFNIISVAVDSTGWIKLATVATNAITKFFMRNGSNNSEEVIEFDVYATYVQAKNYVNVTRQTYYQHVLEIRITGTEGGNPTVYVRCRTSDFAPTFSWQIASAWYLPVPTIHNIEETPGSGPSFLLSGVGYFNSAPVASFTGSLGIGTISPTGILHTAGSGNQTVYFTHTDNVPGRTVTLRLGSDNATYINRSTFIQAIQGSGIDNYALAFGTTSGTDASAQTRMLISTTGNVGIGTTSPQANLHVADGAIYVNSGTGFGAIRIGDPAIANAGNQYQYINFGGDTAGQDAWQIGKKNNVSDSVGPDRGFYIYDLKASAARLVIASGSGNVGIGTTSPEAILDIIAPQQGTITTLGSEVPGLIIQQRLTSDANGNTGPMIDFRTSNGADVWTHGAIATIAAGTYAGQMAFYTQPGGTTDTTGRRTKGASLVERMRIDENGNVGIGVTPTDVSGYRMVEAKGSSEGGRFRSNYNNTVLMEMFANSNSVGYVGTKTNHVMVLFTNDTERARITTGGYFKATDNGTYRSATAAYHEFQQNTGTSNTAVFDNRSATPYGIYIAYPSAAPNGTSNEFLACGDSAGGSRAAIRSNGGLVNYQSNNADLSDIRTKTDITPVVSMWDKVSALEIVTYKYTDQTHDDVNIGVIAQQVEQVEPVWVDSDGFGETPIDDIPLKTVYTKDITFAAIRALQEAMSRIEVLEQEIRQLKGS